MLEVEVSTERGRSLRAAAVTVGGGDSETREGPPLRDYPVAGFVFRNHVSQDVVCVCVVSEQSSARLINKRDRRGQAKAPFSSFQLVFTSRLVYRWPACSG